MIDVRLGLGGAVGEVNRDVQIVISAPQVVIPGRECQRDLGDLISRRASHSRLRIDVERWIATCKSVAAEGGDWRIDAAPASKCLKLSHVPVVFTVYSLRCINRCKRRTGRVGSRAHCTLRRRSVAALPQADYSNHL